MLHFDRRDGERQQKLHGPVLDSVQAQGDLRVREIFEGGRRFLESRQEGGLDVWLQNWRY